MPAQQKLITVLIAFLAIFLFSPGKVFAQVVINEFLPNPSSGENEWVELYNTGDSSVNLAGWILTDEANHNKTLDHLGSISPAGFVVYEYPSGDGWLNNSSGDTVILKNDDAIVDSYSYDADPGEGITFGRSPDGADNWIVLDSATPGSANSSVTPTPSLSPSPTPISSPTQATYKINEVKDEDGNILSSVRVYVDGVYVHHYAPETLTFCDGCQCDSYVSCGFGGHTIKLEKSGFANWSEARTVSAGGFYEVSPVMSSANSNSLSNSSPRPSPSLTPSPKPTKAIGATLLGKILGEEESSPAGFFPWEATEEAESQEVTGSSRFKFIPKLFLGLGLVFLVSAGFWLWYTQRVQLK